MVSGCIVIGQDLKGFLTVLAKKLGFRFWDEIGCVSLFNNSVIEQIINRSNFEWALIVGKQFSNSMIARDVREIHC